MAHLETERLLFRDYSPDDLDRLSGWFADPVIMKYYGGVKTRDEAREWIERWLWAYDEWGYGLWVVVLKEEDTPIGHCGLINQVVDDTPELEVGYLLNKDYWKRGLATEAAGACYDHALNGLGRLRVISIIKPENAASIRVARRNGLTLDKTTTWRDMTVNVYAKHKE